uniref:Uncharacterized protein n=1 Tax=Romanomermis culicivorax TaxID=13658 RepID=A0A915K1J5_ROMCU
MKKVLSHSRSLVWNRPIENSLIWEFAKLGIAQSGIRSLGKSLNWESLNWEFAQLGIARMGIAHSKIAHLGIAHLGIAHLGIAHMRIPIDVTGPRELGVGRLFLSRVFFLPKRAALRDGVCKRQFIVKRVPRAEKSAHASKSRAKNCKPARGWLTTVSTLSLLYFHYVKWVKKPFILLSVC